MSTEANKATLRRMLYDVIVGGDLDLMDELVAPSFLNHNVVGTAEASHNEGIETFRQEIRAVRQAMPDIEIEIVH
ncbi:MAG: nuclear transport factor 2 family protein, partial [Chloroflexi bacterium]